LKEVTDSECKSETVAPVIKVTEKFDSNAVRNLVADSVSNQRVRDEYADIKERIAAGINPRDIGGGTTMVRGRVYIKTGQGRYLVETGKVEVTILGLGMGYRGNMKQFVELMNKNYNAGLQYTKI
jgi:hypothetical protein